MSDTHPAADKALAHHFEDIGQQRESVALGIWVFLVTEIMFFGGLFTAYTLYRASYPQAFAQASHHLDVVLGAVNTAVLIGSSLTMVLAVHAAAHRRKAATTGWILATALLGSVFLGIKAVEYSHKFHDHLVPGAAFRFDGPHAAQAQLFFSIYFAMTGIHALHMVIGIAILLLMAVRAARGRYTQGWHDPVEVIGLYWHFVDIIWIFLFPLLYLLDRHGHS
jgi:cytochrome c oxidase subunit 3